MIKQILFQQPQKMTSRIILSVVCHRVSVDDMRGITRQYNMAGYFLSPPLHLCAITNITEISLRVTLSNKISLSLVFLLPSWPSFRGSFGGKKTFMAYRYTAAEFASGNKTRLVSVDLIGNRMKTYLNVFIQKVLL